MGEAFRARAEHCDLSVVLQLVSAQWLTGRLVVESDLAIEATIECFEGLPIGATCGPIDGLMAFYEAFLVPQTQFTFFVQQVEAAPDRSLGEVMVLLLEACRRLDEWRSVSLRRLKVEQPPPPEVDGAMRPLWNAFDGSRTVGPVVEHLGVTRAAVVDTLRQWIDAGLVREVETPDANGAAPVTLARESARPDTVAVLAKGRAQVRNGEIRQAIASFQHALLLDPHHLLAQQHLLRLRQLHPDLFEPETP